MLRFVTEFCLQIETKAKIIPSLCHGLHHISDKSDRRGANASGKISKAEEKGN